MLSLFNIKRFIIVVLALGLYFIPNASFALDDISEKEIMEAPISDESSKVEQSLYINDIEVLGANIIKPEYIRSIMKLKKGDLYDKDLMQQDLKTIYKLGYFTERMKAVPIKNENGTISLKVILEENIPITDFTIEGNTVISSEELMQHLIPLKGKPQNITAIN